MKYEDLGPELQAAVDARARLLAESWDISVEEAREWVVAALTKTTFRPKHGTGH